MAQLKPTKYTARGIGLFFGPFAQNGCRVIRGNIVSHMRHDPDDGSSLLGGTVSILGPQVLDNIDPLWVGLQDAQRSGWFLNETNELFRGFDISASDRVLDVGCGNGAMTLYCAQRGAHVTFSDIEAESVQSVEAQLIAQGKASGHRGIVCDSDPLLVPDQSANRIICREVLEHVENPVRVLKELVRAGQSGALYCLTVPGETGETIQKSFAPAAYFEHPNHIRIFSKDSFIGLVEDSGLEIQSYTGTGFFWTFWMSMHWAIEAQKSQLEGGATTAVHDSIKPPFDESLHQWAKLWARLTSTDEGLAFKHELDALLPKNQVIVARKPE